MNPCCLVNKRIPSCFERNRRHMRCREFRVKIKMSRRIVSL
jgi:hypothetical protein